MIKKIFCFLFGHSIIFFDEIIDDSRYRKRKCKRCGFNDFNAKLYKPSNFAASELRYKQMYDELMQY